MGAFIAALPTFIASLPALFQLAVKFMTLTEKVLAWANRNDLHNWFNEVEGAIDGLDNAKTSEDKRKAASHLSGIIRKLG